MAKKAKARASSKQGRRAGHGCYTTLKPIGRGRYGVRVYLNGRVIDQDNSARSRPEAVLRLKELLRMTDKNSFA